GSNLPASNVVRLAAWCQAETLDDGRFLLAGRDTSDGTPWVHVYDVAGVRASEQLDSSATTSTELACIAVGGADLSTVVIADSGQYWVSEEGAGNALRWPRHAASWGEGVKIAWSAESGWVAVWQSTRGQFSWRQSDDLVTWSLTRIDSMPFADGTVGDIIPGSTPSGAR